MKINAHSLKRGFYYLKLPFKRWLYEFLDQVILHFIKPGSKNAIMIFRLDLLGDYLVSRPFFRAYKNALPSSVSPLVFAGNALLKDLPPFLDEGLFDDFFWIDRNRFINNPLYRFRVLKTIRKFGISTLVYPSHTRQYWLESVVRVSAAQTRITASPTGRYMNQLEQKLSKSWYSQVVETGNQPVFEFFRNQSFFGQVMQRPGLQVSMRHPRFTHTKKEKVIVLAPGASTEERRWPAEQFAALLNFLFEQSPEFSFVLIGSAAEAGLCRKIKALCGMDLEVLAGITGLRESMQILADSSLLIANESGPVHMAATTGTPCVCISNGNHFGRWNPYPPEIAENILTCYPDSFYPLDKNYSRLLAAYHDRSELPASEVSFERVYSACLSLLGLSGD